MRAAVTLSQGVFFNFYFAAYLLSPRFCHRLVGYLEEEACKTYTACLQAIDAPTGPLVGWRTAQPKFFGDGGVFDKIYQPGS